MSSTGFSRLVVCALFLSGSTVTTIGQTLHVDDDAPLGGDGTSWATAFSSLQDALAAAGAGTEIRVAGGTYRPGPAGGPAAREARFVLIEGVRLCGGYRGLAPGGSPDDRDDFVDLTNPLFESVLSGDLLGDDGPDFANYADNVLHVVTGNDVTNATLLEGFTVRGGNADTSPNNCGGGAYLFRASPTVRFCRFVENQAESGGGGVCAVAQNAAEFDRCLFLRNRADRFGGAANCNGAPRFLDCSVIDNHADEDGGGISGAGTYERCVFRDNHGTNGGAASGGVSYLECRFEGNTATEQGGAVYVRTATNLRDCTFIDNAARAGGAVAKRQSAFLRSAQSIYRENRATGDLGEGGGAILLAGGPHGELTDCVFIANETASGPGGAIVAEGANQLLLRCTFERNIAATNGGALSLTASATTFYYCSMIGNEALGGAGGAITIRDEYGFLVNCLLSGNRSTTHAGGAVAAAATLLWVENSTIAANHAPTTAGGVFISENAETEFINSILWGNQGDLSPPGTSAQYDVDNATARFRYNIVQGRSFPIGVRNIDRDPQFEALASGKWTSGPLYDPVSGETMLVDANTTFVPGTLAGLTITPDTGLVTQYRIVGNTVSTIIVRGDASALAGSGTPYRVESYQLQAGSPAIDAGNRFLLREDLRDLDGDDQRFEYLPLDLIQGPRVRGTDLDLGALEAVADCNGNGVDDLDDVDPSDPDGDGFSSADCNANAVPDECELAASPFRQRLFPGMFNSVPPDWDRAQVGTSLAIDNRYAVIGEPFAERGIFPEAGIVAVNEIRSGAWAGGQVLLSQPVQSGSEFGRAVAIDLQRIVAGAPRFDATLPDSGAAFVFEQQAGIWVRREPALEPSDPASGSEFGYSVAIDNNRIVVGAPLRDEGAMEEAGAAYVYRYDGIAWVEEARLVASDADADDHFGRAVAIEDDLIAIGAPEFRGDGFGGAVYIFRFNGNTWVEEAKLLALLAGNVGWSLDTDRGRVLAGAHRARVGNVSLAGAAVLFEYGDGAWNETARLSAASPRLDDAFGYDVDLQGDRALIGSPGVDVNSGAAYVFDFNGSEWIEQAQLKTIDSAWEDRFAASVALSGNHFLIGAPFHDGGQFVNTGAVYRFQAITDCDADGTLDECQIADGVVDCNRNAVLDECELASGLGFDCNGNGVPDDCDLEMQSSRNCNRNAFPDECESDCNQNGVPDDCDLDPIDPDNDLHVSCDENADFIPDECQVISLSTGSVFATLPQAIPAVPNADHLVVGSGRFAEDLKIVFGRRPLQVTVRGPLAQPKGATVDLGGDVLLETVDVPLGNRECDTGVTTDGALLDATFRGAVDVSPLARATLRSRTMTIAAEGSLTLEPGAGLELLELAGPASLEGNTALAGAAVLVVEGTLANRGALVMNGATVAAAQLQNEGSWTGSGRLSGSVINSGNWSAAGDTEFALDLANNGTLQIRNGTVTTLGSLVNNGVIHGDVTGRAPLGDENGANLTVFGSYSASADATQRLPDGVLRLAGDYDVAIDDADRYRMERASIRLIGASAPASQRVEAMSRDIGPLLTGLDHGLPGHFPLDRLHVGSGVTAQLVDSHDNDQQGQSACEAIYVRTLVVESGGVLQVDDCRVYYETLLLEGEVDNPAQLIALRPLTVGDLNCDGVVSVGDINAFVLALTDPDEYDSRYPACSRLNGDCSGDQQLSVADINCFVGLVTGS